jgi:hypothetical protein
MDFYLLFFFFLFFLFFLFLFFKLIMECTVERCHKIIGRISSYRHVEFKRPSCQTDRLIYNSRS